MPASTNAATHRRRCRFRLPDNLQPLPTEQVGTADVSMGKAKKTRKFAEVKRMLNPKDIKPPKPVKKEEEDEVRHVDKTPAALFFRYNTQLGPPYQVIIDTNFINFSIRNKIDLVKGMMDCLYADCNPPNHPLPQCNAALLVLTIRTCTAPHHFTPRPHRVPPASSLPHIAPCRSQLWTSLLPL